MSQPDLPVHRASSRGRIATLVLIATNVGVSLYLWKLRSQCSVFQLSNFGLTWDQLAVFHRWWRPFTALFVHTKLSHLAGNMIELWVFGTKTATIFDIRKYLAVYFIGGVFAGIVLVSYQRHAISFGASLSTISLLGGLLGHYGWRFRCLSLSARWKLALLTAYGVMSVAFDVIHPGAGNIGHAVSLVTGILLGVAFTTTSGRVAHLVRSTKTH